jgi:GTP-binding protein HflX
VRNTPTKRAADRAILCGTYRSSRERADAQSSLEELKLLAESAGAEVVHSELQEKPRLDPSLHFGRGKVESLKALASVEGATVLIVDTELTPVQQRNLESELNLKIVDRTELILDIFAQRARSREGRLQVELAQLQYLMPRLTGKGAELSQQGGRVGARQGPGETKLETDRRRIRTRISALKRSIEHVRKERATRRDARRRRDEPVVALVGYTNAGKSSLFRALTRETATEVSDRLFMTLDPLMRSVRVGPRQSFVLVDTVGFVRRLPHGLVAAFRATLEEVTEADLILHVQDASDAERAAKARAVRDVLAEIGAEEEPARLDVMNKADLLDDASLFAFRAEMPDAALISATQGAGLDRLLDLVAARLDLRPRSVRFRIAAGDVERVAHVYRNARVTAQTSDPGGGTILDADVSPRVLTTLGQWEEIPRERTDA